jgi:hypothetical protein
MIVFQREGDEVELAFAAGGESALKTALLMPTKLGSLQHGDRLTVDEATRWQDLVWQTAGGKTTKLGGISAKTGSARERPHGRKVEKRRCFAKPAGTSFV